MDTGPSRIENTPRYPPMVFLESALIFFGANFLFHQNVFRRSGNRPHFAAFMAVNAFTSYNISEAMNPEAHKHHASAFNNTIELEHRTEIQEKLRLNMFKRSTRTQ